MIWPAGGYYFLSEIVRLDSLANVLKLCGLPVLSIEACVANYFFALCTTLGITMEVVEFMPCICAAAAGDLNMSMLLLRSLKLPYPGLQVRESMIGYVMPTDAFFYAILILFF